MAIAQQRLTLDEFLKLPEEEPALEYEYGRVIQKVSPKVHHSRLQSFLVGLFNRVAERRKLALAFSELRTTFGGYSYVPDVSVYRWDRLPRNVTGRLSPEIFEPPDIAVEIASPGQSVNFLARRCVWYTANGVRVAVLVDPDDESVLVFRPDQVPQALRAQDPIQLADVLPRFKLTVQELFDSLSVR